MKVPIQGIKDNKTVFSLAKDRKDEIAKYVTPSGEVRAVSNIISKELHDKIMELQYGADWYKDPKFAKVGVFAEAKNFKGKNMIDFYSGLFNSARRMYYDAQKKTSPSMRDADIFMQFQDALQKKLGDD